MYCVQRGELTKLTDVNGDGRADQYETIYSWPLSGNYHEYSYGPKIASDGSMFVTANVGFFSPEWWRGQSQVPWRGWTIRITPDGKMEPWATGMRSPCGIGMIDDQFFFADNQGDWIGSGGLVQVSKGDFTGHPAGLAWSGRPESPVHVSLKDVYDLVNPRLAAPGQAPTKPENIADEKPLPLFEAAQRIPGIKTPAVFLPHGILGVSNSEVIVDETKGGFGPYAGQVFIGDQGQSKIMRVFLEKVKGVYQGAAFGFREGFQSGVLRMCWGTDGSLFVGQTNRGWGSTGPAPYGLQRLVWNGNMPFEMKAIRAMPDGFEIEFTQPVDKASAIDPENYQITGFIYKYHPVYGSPVVNSKENWIRGVVVSDDGLRARLVVDSLREHYIHEIRAEGVRSYASGTPLLHRVGYYTLNVIPDGDKLIVPLRKPKAKKQESEDTGAVAPETAPMKTTDAPHDAHAGMVMPDAGKPVKSAEMAKSAKRQLKMPADWGGKVDQTISLGTQPGLKYDKTLITIQAGAHIKWTFSNVDDMAHNCVITGIGDANDVGQSALNLGLKGAELNYIPKTPKILFHTRLVPPATTESIYFTAPAKPGDYTYLCTVPGHSQMMRGVLRVMGK
jgi:azurin